MIPKPVVLSTNYLYLVLAVRSRNIVLLPTSTNGITVCAGWNQTEEPMSPVFFVCSNVLSSTSTVSTYWDLRLVYRQPGSRNQTIRTNFCRSCADTSRLESLGFAVVQLEEHSTILLSFPVQISP